MTPELEAALHRWFVHRDEKNTRRLAQAYRDHIRAAREYEKTAAMTDDDQQTEPLFRRTA